MLRANLNLVAVSIIDLTLAVCGIGKLRLVANLKVS
jgi:hypothetical protein